MPPAGWQKQKTKSHTLIPKKTPQSMSSAQESTRRNSAGYHSDFTGGSEYSGTGTFSGDSGFNNVAPFMKAHLGRHAHTVQQITTLMDSTTELDGSGDSAQHYYKTLHTSEAISAPSYYQIKTTEDCVDGKLYCFLFFYT